MDADAIGLIVGVLAFGVILILLGRGIRAPRSVAAVMASRAQLKRYVINNPTGGGVVDAAVLPGTGRGYFREVVGESVYQDALVACGADAQGDSELSVILAPEPGAVAVKTLQDATIGYLGSEDARRYQPMLLELQRRGVVSICGAKLFGGLGEQKTIGVWLDLDEPASVAKLLGVE
ncbi:MAG: hypothetical protein ABI665_25550 [Vicinamibacterales bacterium]